MALFHKVVTMRCYFVMRFLALSLSRLFIEHQSAFIYLVPFSFKTQTVKLYQMNI
jgi:hypothetical protein